MLTRRTLFGLLAALPFVGRSAKAKALAPNHERLMTNSWVTGDCLRGKHILGVKVESASHPFRLRSRCTACGEWVETGYTPGEPTRQAVEEWPLPHSAAYDQRYAHLWDATRIKHP